MTQCAETRVLKLGGTCPAMPRPFGTIFGKCQGFLATVDVYSGLQQEKTQPADSAAETRYFWPFSKHKNIFLLTKQNNIPKKIKAHIKMSKQPT